MMGIENPLVTRLKKKRKTEISESSLAKMASMKPLLNPKSNYLAYRQHVKKESLSGCIPYVPMYLRDLVLLDELPNYLGENEVGEDFISKKKASRMYSKINHLLWNQHETKEILKSTQNRTDRDDRFVSTIFDCEKEEQSLRLSGKIRPFPQ